ncbi:MAG TPA: AI-2E family transporter [Candidatus Methylacidiphilales bacterium]|nr:AI-2E family transporter [Candidatus Methylacidiphilales bacterium]
MAEYPTERQRRILWTALTALAVTSLLVVAALVFFGFITFLSWSYPILLPIGLAVIIALVLEPVIGVFQKRGLKRGTATLLVCLLTVIGFLLFWAFLLPPLGQQAGEFFSNLPSSMGAAAKNLRDSFGGYPMAQAWLDANLPVLMQEIPKNVANFVYAALAPVGHAFGFVLGFGFVPIYVYYFLADQDRIEKHWHEFVPLRRSWLRDEVVSVLVEINTSLVSYFRGQIIVAGCNGVLTFIGLWIVGVPYSPVLGIIAGALSIVPFLGIICSIIPALLLGFLSAKGDPTLQWLRPLLVLGVFGAVQMTESMFITPRVQSHSTGLHPLAIILGILFWSMLLPGLLGPIVAVPLTCAVVVLLRRYVWMEKKTD